MNGLYPDGGYDQIMDRSSYGSYASGYKECPGISIALLLITALGIGWDFKTTLLNTFLWTNNFFEQTRKTIVFYGTNNFFEQRKTIVFTKRMNWKKIEKIVIW